MSAGDITLELILHVLAAQQLYLNLQSVICFDINSDFFNLETPNSGLETFDQSDGWK